MSGFFRNPLFFTLAAVALALAGAAGWGVWTGDSGDAVVLVDVSPSSAAVPPEGARRFEHSDLPRAVREAGGPRVVLHTDGCDTSGEIPMDPGFPVDIVLAPRRDRFVLTALVAPARTGAGESFGVRVTVGRTGGPDAAPRSARVRLFRDGQRIGSDRAVRLERGERRTVTFVDSVPAPGVARYEARLAGESGGRAAYVRVGFEPQIGVVGPPPDWKGFRFHEADAERPYDAYLVREPVGDPRLRAAIERAVRAGAGLLAVGAVDAPLLPLTENPPEGRAVVVLLDISGSMEPHLAALRQGFFELCARLDPADRVALVRFRGGVVDTSGWRRAADATALWTTPVARGTTELAPALERARELLDGAEARHRRLYVVSDGEWEDDVPEPPDAHRAALFVRDDPPERALRLFPVHARGAAVLTTALRRLEEAAPDRRVREPRAARRGDVPGWLAGALPAQATYRDFPRLYPKGLDERVALWAGEFPIVAAREEGGRIVQTIAPTGKMLRACLADAAVRLRAWRDGRAVRLEATGSGGADFEIGDRRVPARVLGPDRWGAVVDPAAPGVLRVRCAGALASVEAAADAENAGLFPNEEYARALARVSGGRILDGEASNSGRTRAVYATLLAAALLVLAGAWRRRR